jgi:predicted dithiol-disulfide oxidoreductase (DUF899 family)
LLKDEQEFVDKVKSVAQRRRNLPPGGQLKEDYVFQWANDGKVGMSVKFSELFADKNTLLLYSFMYGPGWDNPCPSCTSLVDGFDRDSDDMQRPVMHVFRRQDGKIVHFWATELSANHVDTVWPYWNLMDFTPEGRPDTPTPPQKFRSEFLEKHYLNKE